MKILFFCRRFYPLIGGVEKHVLELSKKLIAQGHEVTVITESSENAIKKSETVAGIIVYRMQVGQERRSKKYRIWKNIWTMRKIIEESDVVHCHDVFFWYLPFRLLYPAKPVYTTFHGYESYPIKRKAILIRKLSEKLSWGNICIGEFIPKWYGTKATYVSYGAASQIKIQEENVKQNASAVFMGRLDIQTGIATYINAIKKIKKKYPKFSFLVVGDGVDRKKVEKEKIKITGFITNPERYFSHYRFAFVSRYLSILEAMLAKRLVFAVYDNPVKEDYLRLAPFAGMIVIVSDTRELTEKVDYYLMHPKEEKKLVENAYAWASKQTWTKMVNLYLRLWKRKKE